MSRTQVASKQNVFELVIKCGQARGGDYYAAIQQKWRLGGVSWVGGDMVMVEVAGGTMEHA